MTIAGCPAPVPFETLVALWAGDLGSTESEAVEAHLFACDICAAASDRLAKVVASLRQVIPPVISHAYRDQLVARGMRLRHTPVQASTPTEAHFAPDVDLLVHVLQGKFAGAERVDIEFLDPQGISRLHIPHVAFDAGAGEVLIACQRHYQYDGAMTGDPIFQLSVFESGRVRETARYFVRHHWG